MRTLVLVVAVLVVGCAGPQHAAPPGPSSDVLNDRAWRAVMIWSEGEWARLNDRFALESGTVDCSGDYQTDIANAYAALQGERAAVDFWIRNADVLGSNEWERRFGQLRQLFERHDDLLFKVMDLCEKKRAAAGSFGAQH